MKLFIAGTDTDIGKTFVSAVLALSFQKMGINVLAQKWVSTGNHDFSEDIHYIYKSLGLKELPLAGSDASPYCFLYPCSPHLAAKLDGRVLDESVIIKATKNLSSQCELLLIEGAGGLMVPLREDLLLADLLSRLRIPTLLVAKSGLGTINHTLLSIEALRKRDVPLLGVIFNARGKEDPVIVKDNIETILRLSDISVYGPVPHLSSPTGFIENISHDCKRILAQLKKIGT